jgi:6,7-dimethyl-8-ribityllumazine synthase
MGKSLDTPPPHYVAPKNSHTGALDGRGQRIGIVCARFNQQITKSLLMGAIEGLQAHGVNEEDRHIFWVPGAVEIPLVVSQKFPQFDAMIAIGCVIRGDTPHFDYVCNAVTEGLTMAMHQHQKPAIFCVLTTESAPQAIARSTPNCPTNKGYEAALSAIEMVHLLSVK